MSTQAGSLKDFHLLDSIELMGPKRSKFGKDYSWSYKSYRGSSITFEHEAAIAEMAKVLRMLFLWHSFEGDNYK
ncbi:hypothetical protein HK104_007370, partial [Borealophlyctis nickersoniae]